MAKPKPVVKEGKVVSANKKFYVVIGRTRRVIPTGALVDAAALKKLAGKPVPVTVLEKSIVAIGPRPEVESTRLSLGSGMAYCHSGAACRKVAS